MEKLSAIDVFLIPALALHGIAYQFLEKRLGVYSFLVLLAFAIIVVYQWRGYQSVKHANDEL